MQLYTFGTYQIEITEKSDFNFSVQNYPKLVNTIVRCKQIHSNILHEYHDGRDSPQGDGIYSNTSNIKLAIGVSDCNVIVFMGEQRFGILHAGWRGLKDSIIQIMINKLQEKGESDLKVFIGPSIRSCCYEVGEEFLTYFDHKYLIQQTNGKYIFDMISAVSDILVSHNISDITIHPSCTKCSTNFFSYRNGDGINNLINISKKHD